MKRVCFQECLVIIGCIVLMLAFFNTPGMGDVNIWIKWMKYAGENGIIKGYALQGDMYPPLALVLQIFLKNICPFLSDFQVLRIVNIFFLLITVLIIQVLFKNSKVSLLVYGGLMLSMNIGYLDIEICPFLILAFYFLSIDKYVLSGIFFSILCLIKFQPLIIMPFVCLFFVDIFWMDRHKFSIKIRRKDLLKVGMPAFLLGGF